MLAVGGYAALRTSLPQTDSRITVSGVHAEVTIARDADGVPTIIAKDDDDLAFGLGYAHAQDRLFQMELQRRYGAEGYGASIYITDPDGNTVELKGPPEPAS